MRKHSHGKPTSVGQAHNVQYLSQSWYPYWLLFLGSYLICSAKCTILRTKIGQYVLFLLIYYYFQKSIIFSSNQIFAPSYFFEHQRPYIASVSTQKRTWSYFFCDGYDRTNFYISFVMKVSQETETKRKSEKSRFWVRDIFLERKQYGKYSRLIQELKTVDREFFLDLVLLFLY